ncbi:MAG: DUF2670 domain-containing protein [Rickettsiaceae bacterium]|nr:DUF2670 domain-containing protein [Rickettsiaceae bacterium]
MLETIFSKLKLLFQSPIVIFIYGIISKWYLMVMVPAIFVTYWVFQGLTDVGFFAAAEKTVSQALNESKAVARYCVPKIIDLPSFWDCLQNPPSYAPTETEKIFERDAKDLLDFNNYDKKADPYAQ